MNLAALIWFFIMVGFLILEAACPFHLVSIWFAAGSLIAMAAALLGAQVWLQITLFMVVSCVLLACLWPFIKKFLNPKLTKTNVDAVEGTVGLVTEAIDNVNGTGHVKLGAIEWAARSTQNICIPKGTQIKADRVEGVKVYVSVVPQPVENQ